MIGLDLNYYWTLNPKQLEKHIKVHKEKQKYLSDITNYNNWNLGLYFRQAMLAKEYPDKPFEKAKKVKKTKVMSMQDMLEVLKKQTISRGGEIKYGNENN